MAIVKLPKTICDKLTSAAIRFWWSKAGNQKGIHWKRKEILCRPKKEGGMGFKDFDFMNTSFLTKQAWRTIQEPSSYWANTLKDIYFPTLDFWKPKDKQGSSWVWKSILKGKDLLKSFGWWTVGTGDLLCIADDNWLASGEKARLLPGVTCSNLSALVSPDHTWNIQALQTTLQPESAINAIQTPISWSNPTDTLYWPNTPDGNYTIKFG